MTIYPCSLFLGPGVWSFGSAGGGGCGFQNLRDLSADPEYCKSIRCPPLLVGCFGQFVNLFVCFAMFVLLGLNLCQFLNTDGHHSFLFLNAKSAIASAIALMMDCQLIDCCLPGFRSACSVLTNSSGLFAIHSFFTLRMPFLLIKF